MVEIPRSDIVEVFASWKTRTGKAQRDGIFLARLKKKLVKASTESSKQILKHLSELSNDYSITVLEA